MSKYVIIFLVLLLGTSFLFGGQQATPLQMLFSLKKVFPDVKEYAVFVDDNELAALKPKLERAAAQSQNKIQVYPIKNATDIGKHLKSVADGAYLIIFDSDVFNHKKSKLYILSKCKEKQIAVITTSEDYTQSGAIVGIYRDAEGKLATYVNLKHSKHLVAKFTDDFVAQAGIAAVIR